MFVLPSIGSEGLPRALLEAMAAGIPCVGANISGIPEILDDGKFGFLVRPKDAQALAQAMMEVIKMSERERARLVEKSRQRIMNDYSHEVIIERLQKIYDEIIER